TPYSLQASFDIEKELAGDIVLGAYYLFVRGIHLPRTRNINLFPPVVLTTDNSLALGLPDPLPQQLGRQVFGPLRQDSHFDNIFLLENSASSTFHGITLTSRKRITEKIEFLAGYTFSRTIDDASFFFEQPENPFNLHGERALSAQHQKHRLSFSAL